MRAVRNCVNHLDLDTASVLTIIGGVFYVIGGVVVAAAVGSIGGLFSGSGGLFTGLPIAGGNSTALSSSGLATIGYAVAGFGIISGFLIILGGVLFTSRNPGRRKLGGILTVVMMLLGGLATLGGLVIGFILTSIGAYVGLTSKGGRVAARAGPLGAVIGGQEGPTGTGGGPTNYCVRCGSKLKDGAVFCGACGERIV